MSMMTYLCPKCGELCERPHCPKCEPPVRVQRIVGRQWRAYLIGILTACQHICSGHDQPVIASELLRDTGEPGDKLRRIASEEEISIPDEVYPPNEKLSGAEKGEL